MTLSGIFRDLLPLQTRMLAEAAWKAATADEPVEMNFVRAHALATMPRRWAATWRTAALRVFSNAEGAYGSNVNRWSTAALGRRGRTGRRLPGAQELRLWHGRQGQEECRSAAEPR
jgi:hypothetical protein